MQTIGTATIDVQITVKKQQSGRAIQTYITQLVPCPHITMGRTKQFCISQLQISHRAYAHEQNSVNGDLIQEKKTFLEIAPDVSINCHPFSATHFRYLMYNPNTSILPDCLSKVKEQENKIIIEVTQFRCKG